MSTRGIRRRLAAGLRPILLGSLTLAGLATVVAVVLGVVLANLFA